jgi:hypothetical protein
MGSCCSDLLEVRCLEQEESSTLLLAIQLHEKYAVKTEDPSWALEDSSFSLGELALAFL